MSSRFSSRRVAVLATAAVGIAATISPITARAQAVPTALVLPISPVQPFVTCKVRTATTDSFWFGYNNALAESAVVAVGADPTIETNSFGFVTNGKPGVNYGQPDQFKPGTVGKSVAITVPIGTAVTWSINTDTTSYRRSIATTTGNEPTCPTNNFRSSNIRVAAARISWVPGVERRNVAGLLTAATIRFQTTGLRVVCSTGGLPTAPRVLWGFADDYGFVLTSTEPASYAPIAATAVVRNDVFETYFETTGEPAGPVTFVRTYQAIRRVADPQSLLQPIPLAQFGPKPTYGFSQTTATADVSGGCTFPVGGARAPVVWFGGSSSREPSTSLTDPTTQSTREFVQCDWVNPALPCDVVADVIGPGGTRSAR